MSTQQSFWTAFNAFCLVLVGTANGQTFDNVIRSNRYIDCRDVVYNAQTLVATLYEQNEWDSLYQFIGYWESKCGPSESTQRLRRLLDIRTTRFLPDSINESWIELLIAYKDGQVQMADYLRYSPHSQLDLIHQMVKFDSLTRRMAATTLSEHVDGALLLDFYSSAEPSFEKIKNAGSESKLWAVYHDMHAKLLRRPKMHMGFMTGIVQNYGRISLFGNRPNFGIVYGVKAQRHNYDFVLDVRAGPSREAYSFVYQDSLMSGKTWTGVYLGFEYTFDFIHTQRLDVGFSPGIAYDRVTALTADNDYGEDPKGLGSFNKNIGLVWKYKYGKNGGYLGFHLRYNWVDYKNPGGTLLSGQYLNVRIVLGVLWDYPSQVRLQRMD